MLIKTHPISNDLGGVLPLNSNSTQWVPSGHPMGAQFRSTKTTPIQSEMGGVLKREAV